MVNRRNFLKTLGIGLAYAFAPVVFLKEKAVELTGISGWKGVSGGIFSITIDDKSFDVGPVDFSGLNTENPVDKIIADADKGKKKLVWKPGDFGHFEFVGGDDG